jgi:Delta7-sterol 5-desaturase
MPSFSDISAQISVASVALPLYALMPSWGEWFMERGWTYAYFNISDIGGWQYYVLNTVLYILFVEWGIYWVHRLLHDIKPLYNALHRTHHIYNNRNSLSPFAGLAFDPIDGMLQASPYIVGLFVVPIHFWTHIGLLFFTGIWTTNIHDTIRVNSEPIMGAGYHTYHHTAYKDNYGQFFVLFDWLHDTLTLPKEAKFKKSE